VELFNICCKTKDVLRTHLIIVKSCLKFCDIKLLLSAFVLLLQLTSVYCYSDTYGSLTHNTKLHIY
jgi:hypothetical protein